GYIVEVVVGIHVGIKPRPRPIHRQLADQAARCKQVERVVDRSLGDVRTVSAQARQDLLCGQVLRRRQQQQGYLDPLGCWADAALGQTLLGRVGVHESRSYPQVANLSSRCPASWAMVGKSNNSVRSTSPGYCRSICSWISISFSELAPISNRLSCTSTRLPGRAASQMTRSASSI